MKNKNLFCEQERYNFFATRMPVQYQLRGREDLRDLKQSTFKFDVYDGIRTNTPGQIPTGQIPTGQIPTGQLPPGHIPTSF